MTLQTQRKNNIDIDEDVQQMLLVADGDHSAFIKLYRKYSGILRSYLQTHHKHHLSHDDLVQEVFVRIWRNRRSFQAESTVKTYLFGVLINILSEERKRVKLQTISLERCPRNKQDSLIDTYTPEIKVHNSEVYKAVQNAVSELTIDQRRAVKLTYSEQMLLAEASAHADCSTEAFRSRLRRAHKSLQNRLCHLNR